MRVSTLIVPGTGGWLPLRDLDIPEVAVSTAGCRPGAPGLEGPSATRAYGLDDLTYGLDGRCATSRTASTIPCGPRAYGLDDVVRGPRVGWRAGEPV